MGSCAQQGVWEDTETSSISSVLIKTMDERGSV